MKKSRITFIARAFTLMFALFFLNSPSAFSQTLVPNQMLISFVPGTTAATIANYKNSLGAVQLAQSPVSNVLLWQINNYTLAYQNHGWININEVVNGSSGKADVNSADLNYMVTIPSSNHGNAQSQSLDPTQVCPEFSIFPGTKEKPVKVAVLDTGIGYTISGSNRVYCHNVFNPFFKTNIGYDYVNNDTEPQDDHGHGTHIAGIIAQMASLEGLDLELLSFKTHNSQGIASVFNIVQATDQAVLRGAHIINMSFSYQAALPGNNKPDAIEVAIEAAGNAGVLVVAAAGNLSGSVGTPPAIFYPASFDSDNILSVASVNCNRMLSAFSTWGIPQVDIAMLGELIAGPHYITGNMVLKSGTSQASAIVAGIAAQLASNMDIIHYAPLKCSIMEGAEPSVHLAGLVVTGGVANGPEALMHLIGNECNLVIDGGGGGGGDLHMMGGLPQNVTPDAQNAILMVFPNPFSNELSVKCRTLAASEISLAITNALGEIIHADKALTETAGEVSFSWNPEGTLSPGLYFIKINAPGQPAIIRKVVKN